MAKKKVTKSKINFTPDMEFLTHKYADYYNDTREDSKEQKDTSYIWYDTRELYYPYYKSLIKYVVSKESALHPIILNIFKILEYLNKLQSIDYLQILQDLTQLDSDILGSIINEYKTLGYILESGALSQNGQEALHKDKQKELKQESAYILSDGILGNIIESNKIGRDIKLESTPNKDAIELRSQGNMRPRTQALSDIFIQPSFIDEEINEDSNKTLRTILIEGLKGLDSIESQYSCDVVDILEVQECKKFFRKYICLFYKNIEGNEKILAINEEYLRDIQMSENSQDLESLEAKEANLIDESATQRLVTLVDTSKFNAQNNKAFGEYKRKFNILDSRTIEEKLNINLTNGHTIDASEHKKYFKYILENAKKCVYIQSPWIRGNVLNIYKNDIESALRRGVKIYIKYGLTQMRKDDKESIDNISRNILDKLKQKFKDLLIIKKDNSHAKILICDENIMIIGSLNWLSFGIKSGKNNEDNNTREEISNINTNKDSIKREIEKFK